jgi:hypothetical protein
MARRRGQRIGWKAQPDDASNDAAELRHTAAVAEPYDFDTPPVAEVLQAETGQPDEPIPVRLTNPVQVNQLPTRLASMFSVAFATAGPTQKVLNEDPRRAALRITVSGGTFAIGRTQAEAADASAYVITTNAGPYIFHFVDELWARRITGVAADRLSISVEQWAR